MTGKRKNRTTTAPLLNEGSTTMAGIYCWGNTSHGELGLGGIPEEQIAVPRKMTWDISCDVKQVSCGAMHTLFLLSNGKVYSCGCNDNGQLGHELPTKRPQIIAELESSNISYVCAGGRHSHALSDWGQIYSWGDNDYGQLGLGIKMHAVNLPKLVRALCTKTVVQISLGYNHSLALTNCGELYAWGSNVFGQLGISSPQALAHSSTPERITSLDGIPIAFIACGSYHSFVVSKSGAVFGWGRNDSGQLGLNDNTHHYFPAQLTKMRSLQVRYIACGEDFSVFLTNGGGVFTCGSGLYGQLGHGNNTNEAIPRMVTELMGSSITQIACGLRHTLALVPSRGRVYGFGVGYAGQLGNRLKTNTPLPQVVVGPWVSPSGHSLLTDDSHDRDVVVVRQIFCGGDHSMVTTILFSDIDKVPAVDYRIYEPKTQILYLTRSSTTKCAEVGKHDMLDLDFLATIELIFKSKACLNASFLLENDEHMHCTPRHHGVDLEMAAKAFDDIRRIQNETLKHTIFEKLTTELIPTLNPSPADVETLRLYLILPLYHEFVNTKNYERLHTPFSKAAMELLDNPKKIVCRWWAESPIEWFEQLVTNFKHVVGHIICFQAPNVSTFKNRNQEEVHKKSVVYDSNLVAALDFLAMLHEINKTLRTEKIHYSTFYYDELAEHVDIEDDYLRWVLQKKPDAFNICKYPFIFNGAVKSSLLQTDQAIRMHHAMHSAVTNPLSVLGFVNPVSQYVVLEVTRENIVEDTLREIMQYNPKDLKKPLKVKFHGEEAEDVGGVRKEFFMLLLREILDPKYGMFKEYEDSRAVWFADTTFETEDMYFLIGVICGLAIYNFTIINLPFPLALYKKLLNVPVDLCDLRDLSPILANSMQAVLDYEDDDFEEVFGLNFEIARNIFGEIKMEPLKPNGGEIAVTQQNKKEFVDLYVDFIFNKSVEMQFKAFHKGFAGVCWGRILELFQPEELMATMVGNENYDWTALELQCEYRNGYSATDPTIKLFWEVFHELSEENKRKFLLYLTGCDRIPIQGMKEIRMTIQPTNDERFLPVAHTCFNLLDLPRFQTKERLKFKLLQALEYPLGFSLV